MMKKGSKFSNVMVFIGAWSTTKIPLLLFEAGSMGWTFMLLRFALNIPVIFLLGWLVEKTMPAGELQAIYLKASESESNDRAGKMQARPDGLAIRAFDKKACRRLVVGDHLQALGDLDHRAGIQIGGNQKGCPLVFPP